MIPCGASASPFFRKVRVVLEEKGIPYETQRLVPVPKTPEILALNPIGKIPILPDGEVVVPDSSVNCAYLERKHPSPALYPGDPAELAKALFLEEYSDTRMGESIGQVFFERVVKPHVVRQSTDESLGAQLGNLTIAGIEIDAGRWPRVARYDRALLARPWFKTAMAP